MLHQRTNNNSEMSLLDETSHSSDVVPTKEDTSRKWSKAYEISRQRSKSQLSDANDDNEERSIFTPPNYYTIFGAAALLIVGLVSVC